MKRKTAKKRKNNHNYTLKGGMRTASAVKKLGFLNTIRGKLTKKGNTVAAIKSIPTKVADRVPSRDSISAAASSAASRTAGLVKSVIPSKKTINSATDAASSKVTSIGKSVNTGGANARGKLSKIKEDATKNRKKRLDELTKQLDSVYDDLQIENKEKEIKNLFAEIIKDMETLEGNPLLSNRKDLIKEIDVKIADIKSISSELTIKAIKARVIKLQIDAANLAIRAIKPKEVGSESSNSSVEVVSPQEEAPPVEQSTLTLLPPPPLPILLSPPAHPCRPTSKKLKMIVHVVLEQTEKKKVRNRI